MKFHVGLKRQQHSYRLVDRLQARVAAAGGMALCNIIACIIDGDIDVLAVKARAAHCRLSMRQKFQERSRRCLARRL